MVMSKATHIGTSAIHMQKFSVEYEFPVHFTEDLFTPANPVLRDTLCRLEPNKRHRCIVFIDDGVSAALPNLANRIATYASHYASNICPASAPMRQFRLNG